MRELGDALLARARNAIGREFGLADAAEPEHPDLREPGATFVTLTKHGHLRGCIGTLEAHRCLDHDVRANALAAAFDDPRFAPMQRDEWDTVRVEVSLLTSPADITFSDERDALTRLRPGIDGVILAWRGRRSTFLPQVWDSLPDPEDFIAQLKRKAGLPADFWADDIALQRYEVRKWKEQ